MTVMRRRSFCFTTAVLATAPQLISCNRKDAAGAPPIRAPATRETPAFTSPTHRKPFPLRVHRGTRYLQDASGKAFFLQGDSPWSLPVQLDRDQVIIYLNDRAARGFTALMFSAIEHYFSSQSPPWMNANGDVPFSNDGSPDPRVDRYWRNVDFIVEQANERGMVCIVHPAYLGYGGGQEGWTAEVLQASASDLNEYGKWLGRRYAGRGVIWCMGGDYGGKSHPGLIDRQWQIAIGIQSADPSAIITAHGARGETAFDVWGNRTGYSLNNIYTGGVEFSLAEREYRRPGPVPFFLIEGYYEGSKATLGDIRRQPYASILSGACGHMFGSFPIWGFGEPNSNGGAGPAVALQAHLDSPGVRQTQLVRSFFEKYEWWRLIPASDSGIVIGDLGSGPERICTAVADDSSFAVIWTPARTLIIGPKALDGGALRAHWHDAATGATRDFELTAAGPGLGATFDPPADGLLVLERPRPTSA